MYLKKQKFNTILKTNNKCNTYRILILYSFPWPQRRDCPRQQFLLRRLHAANSDALATRRGATGNLLANNDLQFHDDSSVTTRQKTPP